MASRFGRNKKRKMREVINQLHARADIQERLRRQAEYALSTAKEEALREYAKKSGQIEDAIQRISHELGRALGHQLLPHAKKLMQCHRDEPFALNLAQDVCNRNATIIEGEIPCLRYRVVVM
jgi:hypothetical protein